MPVSTDMTNGYGVREHHSSFVAEPETLGSEPFLYRLYNLSPLQNLSKSFLHWNNDTFSWSRILDAFYMQPLWSMNRVKFWW